MLRCCFLLQKQSQDVISALQVSAPDAIAAHYPVPTLSPQTSCAGTAAGVPAVRQSAPGPLPRRSGDETPVPFNRAALKGAILSASVDSALPAAAAAAVDEMAVSESGSTSRRGTLDLATRHFTPTPGGIRRTTTDVSSKVRILDEVGPPVKPHGSALTRNRTPELVRTITPERRTPRRMSDAAVELTSTASSHEAHQAESSVGLSRPETAASVNPLTRKVISLPNSTEIAKLAAAATAGDTGSSSSSGTPLRHVGSGTGLSAAGNVALVPTSRKGGAAATPGHHGVTTTTATGAQPATTVSLVRFARRASADDGAARAAGCHIGSNFSPGLFPALPRQNSKVNPTELARGNLPCKAAPLARHGSSQLLDERRVSDREHTGVASEVPDACVQGSAEGGLTRRGSITDSQAKPAAGAAAAHRHTSPTPTIRRASLDDSLRPSTSQSPYVHGGPHLTPHPPVMAFGRTLGASPNRRHTSHDSSSSSTASSAPGGRHKHGAAAVKAKTPEEQEAERVALELAKAELLQAKIEQEVWAGADRSVNHAG